MSAVGCSGAARPEQIYGPGLADGRWPKLSSFQKVKKKNQLLLLIIYNYAFNYILYFNYLSNYTDF